MPRTPQDVTDAELAVLRVLWNQGPATIRQLTEMLYPEGTSSHYATVQKLLERLEAKSCVTRNRDEWPHLFRATMDRDELVSRRLRSVAEKLCDGSLTPLLTHLVRGTLLSVQERQSLRVLLDELDEKPRLMDQR